MGVNQVMKVFRLPAVLLLVSLALAGCKPPTVDPDQALRDTIVGLAWGPDRAFESTDLASPSIYFYVGGTALIDQAPASWSYLNSVFTFIGPLGTFTTASPAFDSRHFAFNYGNDGAGTPQLIHLTR